jgi:hypothetical protein
MEPMKLMRVEEWRSGVVECVAIVSSLMGRRYEVHQFCGTNTEDGHHHRSEAMPTAREGWEAEAAGTSGRWPPFIEILIIDNKYLCLILKSCVLTLIRD